MAYYPYTTDPISKTPAREPYAPSTGYSSSSVGNVQPPSYTQAPLPREPPVELWIGQFWRAVHVIAQTYSPGDDRTKRAFTCFYQSLSELVPSHAVRQIVHDFMLMGPTVQSTLLESRALGSFFTVHRDILELLHRQPRTFMNACLKDAESLFTWTYLMHAYYNILNGLQIESYNTLKSAFERATISKETWGNPLWAMIHFCAYYAPQYPNRVWGTTYKAFLSCLMFVIPCPQCRAHLTKNLGGLDIDPYLGSRDGIFEFTVILHNLVNETTNKPSLTVDEARKIYDPFGQPTMRQNTNTASFWY